MSKTESSGGVLELIKQQREAYSEQRSTEMYNTPNGLSAVGENQVGEEARESQREGLRGLLSVGWSGKLSSIR